MKIVITGGSGLVGQNLKKYLPDGIYLSSKDYDLTKESDVISMYENHKPNVVIHLAAKVGGILDNINKPAEYFTENVLMNTLLIEYARKYNVKRFIGVLSTCIFPDVMESYPMKETDLHFGPPTSTNFSYGYAKRSMAVQIDAYNKQYGTKYQYLIPCNLYGLGDKDHESNSHFITALVKKIFIAKKNNEKNIFI
jgi:GDP-L-fucose synthase